MKSRAELEEPALVLARWYLGRWPGSTNAEGLAAKSIIALSAAPQASTEQTNSGQHQGIPVGSNPGSTPRASSKEGTTPSSASAPAAGNVAESHDDPGSAPRVVGPDAGRANIQASTEQVAVEVCGCCELPVADCAAKKPGTCFGEPGNPTPAEPQGRPEQAGDRVDQLLDEYRAVAAELHALIPEGPVKVLADRGHAVSVALFRELADRLEGGK